MVRRRGIRSGGHSSHVIFGARGTNDAVGAAVGAPQLQLMSQTLKEKAFRGKDRATPQEQISSDEPCFPNRQAQIAADCELCLQLQTIGEQEAGALNSATSSASADIVSGANDVGSTAIPVPDGIAELN